MKYHPHIMNMYTTCNNISRLDKPNENIDILCSGFILIYLDKSFPNIDDTLICTRVV